MTKLGIGWTHKTEMILLKNVASLDTSRLSKKLTVVTNDGKKHDIEVFGKDAEALRDALAPLM
jgi:hypothetical protein